MGMIENTENVIYGNPKTYNNQSFTAGDSPLVIDVETDLGRPGKKGSISCDGLGGLIIEISYDGINYGDAIWLRYTDIGGTIIYAETLDLEGLSVSKIRITHSGIDSAYRIIIV